MNLLRQKTVLFLVSIIGMILLSGCTAPNNTANLKDVKSTQRQQGQYAIGQPVPSYDWSLERQMVIELYNIRNQKSVTHSVWRSQMGMIEGDCPSYGYGIPYDTSLTNPLVATTTDEFGSRRREGAMTSIELPEPNGVYASKTTAATWVMCLGQYGTIEPVYIETLVTTYPGPMSVDYKTNRVSPSAAANVMITVDN